MTTASERAVAPDFKGIFEALPECYLILLPDEPRFTIVAVNDAYALATNTDSSLLGKGLFEAFPDKPDDPRANGVQRLSESLRRVLERKAIDFMPVQKYDIPTQAPDGGFEERYWTPDNSPVLDAEGRVQYVIHHVTDVTAQEQLIRLYGSTEDVDVGPVGRLNQTARLEKLLIGRELKMAQLKKENGELKKRLGLA